MIKNKISFFSGSFGIFGEFVVFPSFIAFIYFLYYIIQLIEIILKKISKKLIIINISEISGIYFFIPLSVSLVKFLNFFETELFLDILAKRGIDVFSNFFVLSSFYIIIDIIIIIVEDIYDCNTKILIWVQIGVIAAYVIITSSLS